jgi:hypothetical protein
MFKGMGRVLGTVGLVVLGVMGLAPCFAVDPDFATWVGTTQTTALTNGGLILGLATAITFLVGLGMIALRVITKKMKSS